MMLDDLIALCEPSQVRHMMHVIELQFQRDFISLLPKEVCACGFKIKVHSSFTKECFTHYFLVCYFVLISIRSQW